MITPEIIKSLLISSGVRLIFSDKSGFLLRREDTCILFKQGEGFEIFKYVNPNYVTTGVFTDNNIEKIKKLIVQIENHGK